MILTITYGLKYIQNQNDATTLCNAVQKNGQVIQYVVFNSTVQTTGKYSKLEREETSES